MPPPPPPPAEGIASRLFLGPALRTQPDRRLVSLVREGYETAFEEIVRRYGKVLGRYAAAIVPRHRAEDVTQDAFSKALLALRDSDKEIELRPWLFRIVRNTALNDIRDQPPPGHELFDGSAATGSALEATLKNEEVADLMRRLRALPDPQRAAIVMRELEGLSHDEIAAALGVTGGAARQTIHRARRKLRDGVGLLIPVPVLKALLGGAAGVPAGAAGAAAGGAAAGAAGGGGAAVGLKAAGAVLLVAGTVGTGVALKDRSHDARGPTPTLRVDDPARQQDGSAAATGSTATLASDDAAGETSGESGRDHGRSGSNEGGNSGPGDGAESHEGEASHGGDGHGDRSGPGGDATSGGHSGDDHSGSGGGGETSHSGPGSGGSDDGHSGDDGGGSGSGSSGPGSGATDPLNSLSDSGSSGSGSESSTSGSDGGCVSSRPLLSDSASDDC